MKDQTTTEIGQWWTSPTESPETGQLIMVTGRRDIDKFRKNARFKYRIDISLAYSGDAAGMPDEKTAEKLWQVTDSLQQAFHKDPIAVITGIYTGDGCRDWICYTLSLHIFQKKINEALVALPVLPLKFHAEEDPDWEEYDTMCSIACVDIEDSDTDFT